MANTYGVRETNPLTPEQKALQFEVRERVYWADPRLVRITRLRLLSDPGLDFWDVSYCIGQLANGSIVDVSLPFHQLERSTRGFRGQYVKKPSLMRQIVAHGIRDKVYVKRLGIDTAISTLV